MVFISTAELCSTEQLITRKTVLCCLCSENVYYRQQSFLSVIFAQCTMLLNPGVRDLHHFSSVEVGLDKAGTVGIDGRRRRYSAGPKKGITDSGRSQDPLSYHFRAVMSL